MKKIMILLLSGLLALTGMTAQSFAQSSRSRPAATSVSVTVVRIRDFYAPDDIMQVPDKYRRASPQTVALAQQEIRTNAAIRAVLQRKRINPRNVVGVQTALNGGKIVYVR